MFTPYLGVGGGEKPAQVGPGVCLRPPYAQGGGHWQELLSRHTGQEPVQEAWGNLAADSRIQHPHPALTGWGWGRCLSPIFSALCLWAHLLAKRGQGLWSRPSMSGVEPGEHWGLGHWCWGPVAVGGGPPPCRRNPPNPPPPALRNNRFPLDGLFTFLWEARPWVSPAAFPGRPGHKSPERSRPEHPSAITPTPIHITRGILFPI